MTRRRNVVLYCECPAAIGFRWSLDVFSGGFEQDFVVSIVVDPSAPRIR